ncbi:hypothetical protein HOI83_00385 [Candidatus Uhrbacteria bacterium]|jgi:hypothetical protein|nr:hypothetical protein [Candidatus Uhrbacteria bacterium]
MANAKKKASSGVKKMAVRCLKRLALPIIILLMCWGVVHQFTSNKQLEAEQQRLLQQQDRDRSTIRSQTRVQQRRDERNGVDTSSPARESREVRQDRSNDTSSPAESPRERQLKRERDRTEAGKERDRRREEIRKRREELRGGSSSLEPTRHERVDPYDGGRAFDDATDGATVPSRIRERRATRRPTAVLASTTASSTQSTGGRIPTSDKWLTCGKLPPGQKSKRDVVTIFAKRGHVLVIAGNQKPSVVMETGANKRVVLDDGKEIILPLVPKGSECYFTPRPGGYSTVTLVQFTGSSGTGLIMQKVKVSTGLMAGSDLVGRRFDAEDGSRMPSSKNPITAWLSQFANPTQPI